MTENRGHIFDINKVSLSNFNKDLCSRLSVFNKTAYSVSGFYSFSEARSGDIVPAQISPNEECNAQSARAALAAHAALAAKPLHSMIDPKREAQRLISTINKDSLFLIFLGLGGGFLPEAALELTDAYVIVIDFDIESIAELFSNIDYSKLLKNSRFKLLIDPGNEELKTFIIEHYKPALYGGIQTIPLRTRVENHNSFFNSAVTAIHEAIDIVSGDYTVQAHFGKRWFSNIIRNLKSINSEQLSKNPNLRIAEQKTMNNKLFSVKNKIVIAAAGPSLDLQITEIVKLKKEGAFIISTDTAFPVLAHNKIEADAIVSIDCQHISYYHLFTAVNSMRRVVPCNTGALNESDKAKLPSGIPLILDIASPPTLSRFSGFTPFFFSSGHPLAGYIAKSLKDFPVLDTSGGNVTYACLSLAEYLNAKEIIFFGADFSYVNCQTYAKGTYIYPYFQKRQNRFSPLEAQLSKFLYRSPFLPPENDKQIYYETASLRFYRKKLEEKASDMTIQITFAKGLGAKVSIKKEQGTVNNEKIIMRNEESEINSEILSDNNCVKFLEQYKDDIAALPAAENVCDYLNSLSLKDKNIFTTLLPYIAVLKKRNPELQAKELIEKTKTECVREIEKALRDSKFH